MRTYIRDCNRTHSSGHLFLKLRRNGLFEKSMFLDFKLLINIALPKRTRNRWFVVSKRDGCV